MAIISSQPFSWLPVRRETMALYFHRKPFKNNGFYFLLPRAFF